jgi:hypothetical protein
MKCILCEETFHGSNIVGVGRKNISQNTGPMVEHPVCFTCFWVPAHRKHQYKLHFHDKSNAAGAVAAAKRLDEASQRGEDLSL